MFVSSPATEGRRGDIDGHARPSLAHCPADYVRGGYGRSASGETSSVDTRGTEPGHAAEAGGADGSPLLQIRSAEDVFASMSARDLKRELLERGVDTSLFLEKGELIEALVGKLRRAGPDGGAGGTPPTLEGMGPRARGGGVHLAPAKLGLGAAGLLPSPVPLGGLGERRGRGAAAGGPKYYVAADTATGRVRVVHEAMPTGGAGPGDVDEETGYEVVDCRLVGRNGAVFA